MIFEGDNQKVILSLSQFTPIMCVTFESVFWVNYKLTILGCNQRLINTVLIEMMFTNFIDFNKNEGWISILDWLWKYNGNCSFPKSACPAEEVLKNLLT